MPCFPSLCTALKKSKLDQMVFTMEVIRLIRPFSSCFRALDLGAVYRYLVTNHNVSGYANKLILMKIAEQGKLLPHIGFPLCYGHEIQILKSFNLVGCVVWMDHTDLHERGALPHPAFQIRRKSFLQTDGIFTLNTAITMLCSSRAQSSSVS